jgi:NADH-quinone oxidoreductase subunit L
MKCSIGAVVLGMSLGWILYHGRGQEAIYAKPLANKFYVDEIYEAVLIRGQQMVARILQFIDEWILGFLIVRGSATMTNISGELLRLFQAGNLQGYVFVFTLGALGLVYWMMRAF